MEGAKLYIPGSIQSKIKRSKTTGKSENFFLTELHVQSHALNVNEKGFFPWWEDPRGGREDLNNRINQIFLHFVYPPPLPSHILKEKQLL